MQNVCAGTLTPDSHPVCEPLSALIVSRTSRTASVCSEISFA